MIFVLALTGCTFGSLANLSNQSAAATDAGEHSGLYTGEFGVVSGEPIGYSHYLLFSSLTITWDPQQDLTCFSGKGTGGTMQDWIRCDIQASLYLTVDNENPDGSITKSEFVGFELDPTELYQANARRADGEACPIDDASVPTPGKACWGMTDAFLGQPYIAINNDGETMASAWSTDDGISPGPDTEVADDTD